LFCVFSLSSRSATLSHGLNLHFYLQHTHTHSLLYHHHCSPFFILTYESCGPLLIIILIHRQDPQYLSHNRQPSNRRLTHSCNSLHILPVDSLPFPCACCCLYAHFSYLYEPRVHITNRNICNVVNHLHIIRGEVNIYVLQENSCEVRRLWLVLCVGRILNRQGHKRK